MGTCDTFEDRDGIAWQTTAFGGLMRRYAPHDNVGVFPVAFVVQVYRDEGGEIVEGYADICDDGRFSGDVNEKFLDKWMLDCEGNWHKPSQLSPPRDLTPTTDVPPATDVPSAPDVPQELAHEVAKLMCYQKDGNAIAKAIARALPEFTTVDKPSWTGLSTATYLHPKQDNSVMVDIDIRYYKNNPRHVSYYLSTYEYDSDGDITPFHEEVCVSAGSIGEELAGELISNVLGIFSSDSEKETATTTTVSNVTQELAREVAALMGSWVDGNAIAQVIADALPEFTTVSQTGDHGSTYLHPKQNDLVLAHISTKHYADNPSHMSYYIDTYRYYGPHIHNIGLEREDVFCGAGPIGEELAGELVADVLRVFSRD